MRIARWFLAVVASVALVANEVRGQAAPCDTTLKPRGPSGYMARGDRCEGIYVSEVSGTELSLASLTRVFSDYNPDSITRLLVRWESPIDSGITLRARSVKRNVYYGMDTRRTGSVREFTWPTTILANQDLLRRDVGIVGWTTMRIGSRVERVYLPLHIVYDTAASQPGNYQVKIYPSVRLREVYLTLSQLDSLGQVSRILMRGDSLRRAPYGARQPITVPIADPGARGIYRLEISARMLDRNARALTLDPVLFFHPGR
jgi:hypothetical protein